MSQMLTPVCRLNQSRCSRLKRFGISIKHDLCADNIWEHPAKAEACHAESPLPSPSLCILVSGRIFLFASSTDASGLVYVASSLLGHTLWWATGWRARLALSRVWYILNPFKALLSITNVLCRFRKHYCLWPTSSHLSSLFRYSNERSQGPPFFLVHVQGHVLMLIHQEKPRLCASILKLENAIQEEVDFPLVDALAHDDSPSSCNQSCSVWNMCV